MPCSNHVILFIMRIAMACQVADKISNHEPEIQWELGSLQVAIKRYLIIMAHTFGTVNLLTTRITWENHWFNTRKQPQLITPISLSQKRPCIPNLHIFTNNCESWEKRRVSCVKTIYWYSLKVKNGWSQVISDLVE